MIVSRCNAGRCLNLEWHVLLFELFVLLPVVKRGAD